jgi:DNA repair exonuclease SbcCD nuclease subunit
MAGDLIDQDNRYFEAIGPLQDGFDRLNKKGISVYLVTGNHDFNVLAGIIQNKKYNNVHLLGSDGSWEKRIYRDEKEMIQFVGWSFPHKHVQEDPLTNIDRLELDPNIPTIGILHSEADNPKSHYGPVDLDNLRAAGPDAWILGHIHKPIVLNTNDPYIAYPGTPHALNSGEPGIHGPLLLEADGKKQPRVKRIPLSPVRYESIEVAVQPADDESALHDSVIASLRKKAQDLVTELEEVSFLVFDIEMTGNNAAANSISHWTSRAVDEYTQELETGTTVLIRKVVNHVEPAVENMKELAKTPSPAGKLADTILALEQGRTTPFLERLMEKWEMQRQRINRSGTYTPLDDKKRLAEPEQKQAREYILQECHRMLNHLINQQQEQQKQTERHG